MTYFIDIETTGLDPLSDRVLLFQIGTGSHDIEIIDCTRESIPESIRRILEDEKILKVAQNAKFEIKFLKAQFGINVCNISDTMIAEQVLTAGQGYRVGLDALAWKYGNVDLDKSTRRDIMDLQHIGPREIEYARKDVEVLPVIWKEQLKQIEKDGLQETVQLENRLVPIVAKMELKGVLVDEQKWQEAIKYVEEKASIYEEILYEEYCPEDCYCQTDFFGKKQGCLNWYSSGQSREALRSLGINLDSVDKKVLRQYLKRHPNNRIIRALRNYRKYMALSSFDVPEYIHPKDGRVHAEFHQLGARTGRFSCKNPNLQNIPLRVDKDVATIFRSAFVAPPGYRFLSCDLGQIEMRVIAEMANEERMIEAFIEGRDLHLETARLIYKDPTIEHDDPRRDIAKNTNFCLQYGGGAETLAGTARISLDEAKRTLWNYFETYPRIRQWMDDNYEETKARGYTLTVGGRRRYLPGIESDDRLKNAAINTPVQGTATDIAKLGMVEAEEFLYDSTSVLFIHDETVIEAPKDSVLELEDIVRQQIIKAGEHYLKKVPVTVDTSIDKIWRKA